MAEEFENGTSNPRYTPTEQRATLLGVPVAQAIGERPMELIRKASQTWNNNTRSTRDLLSRGASFAFYNFASARDYTPWFTRLVVLTNICVFIAEIMVMNRDFGTYIVDPSLNPTLGPNVETLLTLGAKRGRF